MLTRDGTRDKNPSVTAVRAPQTSASSRPVLLSLIGDSLIEVFIPCPGFLATAVLVAATPRRAVLLAQHDEAKDR